MNAEKCVYCGVVIPEGRQVCPGCEQWALKRASANTSITEFGWDGGTMTTGDVAEELNLCHYDAKKIMEAFGKKRRSHWMISRREFVYQKLHGGIELALSLPAIRPEMIEKAIRILTVAGYKVIKK